MLLIAASLLFTNPVPLEMPRGAAYLVQEKDHHWMEDRYRKFDLWTSRSVDGRWVDDDGRVFLKAHLDVLPPLGDAADALSTRTDYLKTRTLIDKRDLGAVRTAIAALSPIEISEKEMRPRQLPRGYKDVDYWQGTNTSAIVCAYLPEKESVWHLAIWLLIATDDFSECLRSFEKEFFSSKHPASSIASHPSSKLSLPPERELLRADARHAVALYSDWHVTDANEFSILDNLSSRSFVNAITNDLPVMRRAFAAALPTPVDTTNTLAVARIFSNRAEYLEALAVDGITNLTWSAAYWSPIRRELVAHFDQENVKLAQTIRHESFHQYLSYATSMIAVSPWLNEGYAQYFEDGSEGPSFVDPADFISLSELIPAVMMMDYDEFYSGSDLDRRIKYRLALAIVYFLEKGAPKVRFQPFKNVKNDYFAALFKTKDMRKATTVAFKDADAMKNFVAAWTKFWEER